MSALHNGFNHLAQPAASTSTGLSGVSAFSSCRSAEAVSGWLVAPWVDPSSATLAYDRGNAMRSSVRADLRERMKASVMTERINVDKRENK